MLRGACGYGTCLSKLVSHPFSQTIPMARKKKKQKNNITHNRAWVISGTSRGSPTLAIAAEHYAAETSCGTSACAALRGGPNPLDEEATAKFAVGISSLTSGFTKFVKQWV